MAVKGLKRGKRAAPLISEMRNGIVDPAHIDTHRIQIERHLPLVATISNSGDIVAALDG